MCLDDMQTTALSFHTRDLSIHDSGICRGSWKQSPTEYQGTTVQHRSLRLGFYEESPLTLQENYKESFVLNCQTHEPPHWHLHLLT